MKIGDIVKIIQDDIWKQKEGKIVRIGKKNICNLQETEYDYYIQTKTAGIIGYDKDDLIN